MYEFPEYMPPNETKNPVIERLYRELNASINARFNLVQLSGSADLLASAMPDPVGRSQAVGMGMLGFSSYAYLADRERYIRQSLRALGEQI